MTTSRSELFDPALELLPDYAGLIWEYPDEHPDPEDQALFALLAERYTYISASEPDEEPQWRWWHVTHRPEPMIHYHVVRRTK